MYEQSERQQFVKDQLINYFKTDTSFNEEEISKMIDISTSE